MNTTPDEERLALWVEDELDATSRAAVDAWAATQQEWLERREVARQVKALLGGSLPAAEEPPYAEFFNARIAHNAVYDFTRRRRPEGGDEINDETFARDRIDPAAVATPTESRSPDDALAGDELRGKIEAALAKLSPEHREAVILKDVQGLAYKEIADVMECSLGTVMSRLFYARQKLQTLLKDEYDSR